VRKTERELGIFFHSFYAGFLMAMAGEGSRRPLRYCLLSSCEEIMPLDHYVSQVHLRKFYSPALGKRMYAIRKTDLKAFKPDSYSVCRIMDGSTNTYLREERAIEDFLKTIEPNYNAALDKLIAGEIDQECVYTIAGFIAYVSTCSPASMRLLSEPLKSLVETTADIMGAQESLPPPPLELGEIDLAEVHKLFRSGAVKVKINPKYPQAIGIESILELVAAFGNFKWEILHNNFDDNPFFTSDFPIGIEQTNDPRILNRIVPLAPNLALRIRPDPTLDKGQADFSFASFGYFRRNIGRKELVNLNRLIVRCAEETVFYRDDHPWIQLFVAKNRHYRIEMHISKLATPTGIFLVSTQRIVARTPPVELAPAAG
jgi:hypothetical protein